MEPSNPSLLSRYFAGVAESTFQTQLGLADPPLIDYISDLLARFTRSEKIFRIRNLAGKPIREVAEMMCEAQERVGSAKRDVHRHIGDFTLFWSGVYPESIKRMRGETKHDHLIDFFTEGKRSYWIASTILADETEGATSDVLERLSQQFELCAYGLREIRRHWENEATDGGATFLIN